MCIFLHICLCRDRPAELQRVRQAARGAHEPAHGRHPLWLLFAFLTHFLQILFVSQSFSAYSKLRVERMNLRMAGIRAKRAKEAEAAEKDS
jgi:hypothetical protein